MRWLKKEVHGRQLWVLMACCLVLKFVYAFSVITVVYLLEIGSPSARVEKIPIFTISFPITLVSTIFIEEIIFRLPLAIFIKKGWSIARVLVVALILSAVFGILHGSIYHIFTQGVGGFIYSVMFLKSGGLQGHYLKAVMVTTTTHLLFDAILIGVVIAAGEISL